MHRGEVYRLNGGWPGTAGPVASLLALGKALLVYTVVCVLPAGESHAAIVELPSAGSPGNLKQHALYRPDPEASLPPQQLLKSDSGFVGYNPEWEESAPPLWIKLKVRGNPAWGGSHVLLIERRFFQRLSVYLPDGREGYKHTSTGLVDYHPTQMAGNEFVYHFSLGPDGRGTILLHVNTLQGNLAPLSLRIEDPVHFQQQQSVHMWAYGLYFGAMLALIFYNLVLYLNLRTPGHRWYVTAMLCVLVFMALDSGLIQGTLPAFIRQYGPLLSVLFVSLMTAATTRFFQVFSNSAKFIPRLHLTLTVSIVVLMLLALISLLVPVSFADQLGVVTQLAVTLVWLLLIVCSLLAGLFGSRSGFVFLVAWTVFVLSAVARTLISFEVIQRVPPAEYLLYIGSILEAMILALGLSYRVGQLRTQRNIALREQHRANQLANVDPLTGAYNRRFLEAHLDALLEKTGKRAFPGSLIMLDVDNFKEINDKYGHGAGDRILVELSQRCQDTLRAEDVLSRLGGDEFAIILPDRSGEDAAAAAERIRQTISENSVGYDDSEIKLQASIGVMTDFMPGTTTYAAFKRADQAMYRSKRAGKNRVTVVAGEESD